jgi:hypothetical protein
LAETADPAWPPEAGPLTKLLERAGISWFVIVDDQLPGAGIEWQHVVAAIKKAIADRTVTLEALNSVLGSSARVEEPTDEQPDELWPDEMAAWWSSVGKAEHEGLIGGLATLVDLPAKPDPSLAGIDSWFPPSIEYRALSPAQWRADLENSLARDAPGLVLFDLDLSYDAELRLGSEGGLQLMEEAQAKPAASRLVLGILSNQYTIEREPEEWQQIQERMGAEPGRKVIPLAKERLLNPEAFAHGVRLAIVNAAAERLREGVRQVVVEAADEASARIRRLTPWDFERVVLKSSEAEGAWEVDTILRLMGIVERHERRKKAHGRRAELDSSIAEIRNLPSPVDPLPDLTDAVRGLRRQEMLLDAEDLNASLLPIENGDVFEAHADRSLFVLLGPPCDLILRRQSGKRTLGAAPLVPLKTITDSKEILRRRLRQDLYAEAPDVFAGPGQVFLDLRRPTVVDLDVLDLATYRQDGRCRYEPGAPSAGALFRPQEGRRRVVLNRMKLVAEALSAVAALSAANTTQPKAVIERAAKMASSGFSLDTGEVVATPEGPALDFGLRRVGRLLEPRASALLGAYHAAQARAAFERDLTDDGTGDRSSDIAAEAEPAEAEPAEAEPAEAEPAEAPQGAGRTAADAEGRPS